MQSAISKNDGSHRKLSTYLRELLGKKVGIDNELTWANDAAANTQKTFTISKSVIDTDKYALSVYNPSTETALTVKVFAVETALGGASRECHIGTITIPAKVTVTGTSIQAHRKRLDADGFLGCDLKFVVSNDTLIGEAGTFTAAFRLRHVG